VAALNTPDAQQGAAALDPGNDYRDWRQVIAARSALAVGLYRPGRRAAQIDAPLLVLVCDADQSVLAEPGVRAAAQAPRGEVVRIPGGHYEPFTAGHDVAVEVELGFLGRHLLSQSPRPRARPYELHRLHHPASDFPSHPGGVSSA
jgi:pimeloyl-ACP methyl ester carboxylesterase